MHSILFSIHRYQQKVEVLKQTYFDAGKSLTHLEALQKVAQEAGASSWDSLEPKCRRTWLNWLFPQWCREPCIHLDELLFDHRIDELRLGFSKNPEKPVDLSIYWAQRHVLIVGPLGWGGGHALEHYAAQHLVNNGGLLVLDSYENSRAPKLLSKIAKAVGRTDFIHHAPGSQNDLSNLDVVSLVNKAGAAFVSMPFCHNRKETKSYKKWLATQLETLCRASRGSAQRPPVPFMVIVPEGRLLLTDEGLSLLRTARNHNVILVIQLTSIADLDGFPEYFRQRILNFGTKVFLHPNSRADVTSAAELLVLSQDPKELRHVQDQLASLGLGEALHATRTGPEFLKLGFLLETTRAENYLDQS